MPAIIEDGELTSLPFPPVTKEHVLNCSYHSWQPKYKTITPKSRTIPLTRSFLEYLRADGIVLPSDEEEPHNSIDDDSGIFSASDDDGEDDEDEDVAADWRDLHNDIKSTISELGGKVVPKLNWSAPKDATWINSNTMECRSPADVYLLLKSSDFITYDLEHAFDDCIETPSCTISASDIPYHLVLRKAVQFNPSVEFRCFVRRRRLLCMCQRDLNHFDFLFGMQEDLQSLIQEFFDVRLRDTFADENFVFDVYIPAPHKKVWLVDINPWAPRTDPLLFSWLEILTMQEPLEEPMGDELDGGFVRLSIREPETGAQPNGQSQSTGILGRDEEDDEDEDDEEDEDADEELWMPELRLIRRDDPEAYLFNTQKYSAHKLPKDVVDASQSGEGLREFARDWQEILAKRRQEDVLAESSESD